MLNLILFGPPGSGKGTQAQKLVEKYHILHISTGDLFRSEMKEESELGLQAKSFIAQGALVPGEVTIGMLKNKVMTNRDVRGYLFDGFPRTISQAEALDALLASIGEELTGLVALQVSDDELVTRLLLRGKTSGRSDDTDEKIIRNRIAVYEEETSQVFDYYKEQHKAFRIEGEGSIDEIFLRMVKCVESLS